VPSLKALLTLFTAVETPVEGSLAARARVALGDGGEIRLDGEVERASLAVEAEPMELAAPARFSVAGAAIRLERATLVGRAPGSRRRTRSTPAERSRSLRRRVPGGGARPRLAREPAARHHRGFRRARRLALGPQALRDREHPRRRPHPSELPDPLTDINGTVALETHGLRIEDLRFRLAGGDATCSGRVALEPRLELDLVVRADGVPWKLLPRFRPVLDGELRVSGSLERLMVGGEITVVDASFREQLNLNTLVLNQVFARERAVASAGAPVTFQRRRPHPRHARHRHPADPAAGSRRAAHRRYQRAARPDRPRRRAARRRGGVLRAALRDRARHRDVLPARPHRPAFDVLARAWVDNVEVTIALVGTLERFKPTFSSNPPLSEMDILGLLSTGKRGDEGDPESVSAAASKFVNGQLASAVSSRARSCSTSASSASTRPRRPLRASRRRA